MTDDTQQTLSEDTRAYELGFLLLPSLTDEKVADVVTDIRDLIENNNGTIAGEGEAQYRELAYEMDATSGDETRTYRNGYFGWIHFTAEGSATETIQDELRSNDSILRFICIHIDENRLGTDVSSTDEEESEEQLEEADEEEIDEVIDELVIE